MALSTLCFIHCVLAPALMLVLGTGLLTSWLASEWFHGILMIPIILLICTSIVPVFARTGVKTPFLLGSGGLFLFLVSFLFHGWQEFVLAGLAAGLIFRAHWSNARLVNCAEHASGEESL
ncbi:MerC family mercury resistance protein [Aliidiomarina sp. Khilg15.8]